MFLNGLARGCVPADHELFFSRARGTGLKGADVALVVGVPMDFRLGFGQSVRRRHGARRRSTGPAPCAPHPRPVAAELYGGVGATLDALREGVGAARPTARWVDAAARGRGREAGGRAGASSTTGARRCTRCGSTASWARSSTATRSSSATAATSSPTPGRVIDSYEPGLLAGPRARSGASAPGPGYALAAKLAHPDRQVVLLLGDGAFGFCGMEYDTLARHGVDVVGVMGNNGIWALEKHPMEFLYGYSVAAELRPGTRYDQMVEALGGHGELVERPEDVKPRARARLRGGRPGARERADRPVRRVPAQVEPGLEGRLGDPGAGRRRPAARPPGHGRCSQRAGRAGIEHPASATAHDGGGEHGAGGPAGAGRPGGRRAARSATTPGAGAAALELDPARFGPEAVAGLEGFSHLEVVFLFDRVDPAAVELGARHPRGNRAWPRVGIFAQRAKDRPNRLGVSRCRLARRRRPAPRRSRASTPWPGRPSSTSSPGWPSSARGGPSASPPGRRSSWPGTGRPRGARPRPAGAGADEHREAVVAEEAVGVAEARGPQPGAPGASTLAQRSCAWRCSDAAHSSSVVPSARDRRSCQARRWSSRNAVGPATCSALTKTPPGAQGVVDAGEEGALARVVEVVDGEGGDHRVPRPGGQRVVEVADDVGGPRPQPVAGLVEHGRGAVEERRPRASGVGGEHGLAQQPGPGTEVEHPPRAAARRGPARRPRPRRRPRRTGRAAGAGRRSRGRGGRRSSRRRCPS